MNISAELESFLSELDGHFLIYVLVGPAGVHYDFAPQASASRDSRVYSILSNTPIQIHSKEKRGIYATNPYPPYAAQDDLRSLLTGRNVTKAAFDPKKNAARIILDEMLLLSLIPVLDKRGIETYWSVSSQVKKDSATAGRGFYVSTGSIRRTK